MVINDIHEVCYEISRSSIFIIMNDYTRVQFWQNHEKSTRKISIEPSGCKQYNILYIVRVLGLYGEYKTFASRYQPSALPRADISGLRSYIRHIDLKPILYILHIYIYIYIYIIYIYIYVHNYSK